MGKRSPRAAGEGGQSLAVAVPIPTASPASPTKEQKQKLKKKAPPKKNKTKAASSGASGEGKHAVVRREAGPKPVEVDSLEQFGKFLNVFAAKSAGSGAKDRKLINKEIVNWTNRIMLDPRLLHIKGAERGQMMMREVPRRKDSMNSGDVFILDTGDVLYIWHGKSSNEPEQTTALLVAENIVQSRGANTHITMLKEGETDDVAAFWKEIREKSWLRTYEVNTAEAGGRDEDVQPFRKKLYPMKPDKTRNDAALCLQKAWREKRGSGLHGQFAKKKLESSKVFLLDDGLHLWLWKGKDAVMKDDDAYKQATAYLKKKGNHAWYKQSHDRPASLPILLVNEDKEPADFLANFKHIRKRKVLGI